MDFADYLENTLNLICRSSLASENRTVLIVTRDVDFVIRLIHTKLGEGTDFEVFGDSRNKTDVTVKAILKRDHNILIVHEAYQSEEHSELTDIANNLLDAGLGLVPVFLGGENDNDAASEEYLNAIDNLRGD